MRTNNIVYETMGKHQKRVYVYLRHNPGATADDITHACPFANGISAKWTGSTLWRMLRRDLVSREKVGRKYHYYAKA